MFTGIITHLGKISKKTESVLKIAADSDFLSKIKKGVSISINGICLTVVDTKDKYFAVDFMPETESRTNIKYLQPAGLVNLELPATPSSFLSGHIVQGHVDGIGKLQDIVKNGNSYNLKFSISTSLAKYMIAKGSITVNGIALTIIQAGKNYFTIGIIPHTWNNAMLQTIKKGDFVNIEIDILAKYMEKLLK